MSIEERAYMAVGHPHNGGMHVPERLKLEEQTFVNGYIKGATDQRKIDVEKALKVYEDLMTCSGYFPETITAELARMRHKLED